VWAAKEGRRLGASGKEVSVRVLWVRVLVKGGVEGPSLKSERAVRAVRGSVERPYWMVNLVTLFATSWSMKEVEVRNDMRGGNSVVPTVAKRVGMAGSG